MIHLYEVPVDPLEQRRYKDSGRNIFPFSYQARQLYDKGQAIIVPVRRELVPFFVSLTARLRTACKLVAPEKQELCTPSLDECHQQRTHDRFLASGFGLLAFYAKDQTAERERQAQRIERVNNTKATAITRHSIHLKHTTANKHSRILHSALDEGEGVDVDALAGIA